MLLNSQKVQAATQAMMSAIYDYRLTDANLNGLIPEQKLDIALENAMTAFCRVYIDTADKIDSLKINLEINEAFANLLICLVGEVFTGKYKTLVDKNGNITSREPITKSPRSGFSYTDPILERVSKQLVLAWEPKTPKLKHKPDAVRFLEICRDLFPNVARPHVAANAFREFIENVHYTCDKDHTGPAKFEQKALWLYSLRTGGTGKSFFIGMLKAACDKLELDTGIDILEDSVYLNPSIGLHTVTICEDTAKLTTNMATVLNNIIDQTTFSYNVKFGSKGTAKSSTNLVIGSNYVSFERNSRRYNEVEYVQCNVKTALTDQERALYFPLWNNEAQGIREIIEAFEVCPFQSEHGLWEEPIINNINNNLFAEETKPKYVVDDRYLQTVVEIKETIDEFNNDSTSTDNLCKMTPTKFAKLMTRYNTKINYKDALASLKSFLTEMKSNGTLPSRNCSGKCKVEVFQFNWHNFVDMLPTAESDDINFLATIRQEWNALIANEK